MDLKRCSKCKRDLPREDFNRNKSHRDGYNNWCRSCARRLTVAGFWTVYLLTLPDGARYVGITLQKLRERLRKHLDTAKRGERDGPLQARLAFFNLPVADLCKVSVLATARDEKETRRIEKHFINYLAARGEILNEKNFNPGE